MSRASAAVRITEPKLLGINFHDSQMVEHAGPAPKSLMISLPLSEVITTASAP
jgi:hypothetical protein